MKGEAFDIENNPLPHHCHHLTGIDFQQISNISDINQKVKQKKEKSAILILPNFTGEHEQAVS